MLTMCCFQLQSCSAACSVVPDAAAVSLCQKCTAGLRTCHVCLAEPCLLLEQNKVHEQALCVCTSTSDLIHTTCPGLVCLLQLCLIVFLDMCCYAGACALHLDLRDLAPELHPIIDNQFHTAVTVTEVSGVFLPLPATVAFLLEQCFWSLQGVHSRYCMLNAAVQPAVLSAV